MDGHHVHGQLDGIAAHEKAKDMQMVHRQLGGVAVRWNGVARHTKLE
jgi:hypothetical protein